MTYQWLEWAKQIQAIAQIGLTYTKDPYDVERYEELRRISVDILAHHTRQERSPIELLLPMKRVMLRQRWIFGALCSGTIKFCSFRRR